MADNEEVHFTGLGTDNVQQGHTGRYSQEGSFWKLRCLTCGWESTGCSLEEVRFDFRYHGLKTSTKHSNIDWEKLL